VHLELAPFELQGLTVESFPHAMRTTQMAAAASQRGKRHGTDEELQHYIQLNTKFPRVSFTKDRSAPI
jgi:hypothetical protein